MDIRAYNTKDLPYRFVLFCNLSPSDLQIYSLSAPSLPGENSLLTYCYIDKQMGLSYQVVCKARLGSDDSIEFGEVSKTSLFMFREGNLISDALVFPEGYEMEQFQEIADRIKRGYGYHIDMVRTLEAKKFSHRRHICYPDDIMIYLFGDGVKPEQIWVREIEESDCPFAVRKRIGTEIVNNTPEGREAFMCVGAGRLLNQPYNSAFGYDEGDLVLIFSMEIGRGQEEPVTFARNMFVY